MTQWAAAAMTAAGFFWKAGWAFVLGYAISAMLEAFVPRGKLSRAMGSPGFKSVSLATVFGAASSSCSFAALAAARTLIRKGAAFVAGVAFMFASTNLVIELGILILIFLGWQFLAAEIVGGLVLIAISSVLIRLTYPKEWIQAARDKLEDDSDEDDEFDWRKRIKSRAGWRLVGRGFIGEWKMVWQEVTIGFTVAGLVATLVPDSFWKTLFLVDLVEQAGGEPSFWIVLQNAAVAPLVTAATFIGSMGNIPLATVLASGGVLFAGIMGFIYADLIVPPLVKVNAKYYGWRVALYIAGVMYISVVLTAIALHYGFALTGLTPESTRAVEDVTRFKVDYTLFMNIAAALVVGLMIWLARAGGKSDEGGGHQHSHDHGGGSSRWPGVQTIVTWAAIAFVSLGVAAALLG